MDQNGSSDDITRLLEDARKGNSDAADKLIHVVYPELRKMARLYLRSERSDHSLETKDLVHQAYLRMVDVKNQSWENRSHFFAITAHTMRQILIDHARARQAQKRGGKDIKVSIEALNEMSIDLPATIRKQDYAQLIMLDEALSKLEKLDPQQSKVVEMRFFMGLTEEEVAEGTGLSLPTVKREWKAARSWLYREMTK